MEIERPRDRECVTLDQWANKSQLCVTEASTRGHIDQWSAQYFGLLSGEP